MTGADGVEAVLFDLDDTLCRYRQSGRDLLAEAFAAVGVDPFFTVEEYHARYAEFVADSDHIRDLRERCFAAIARETGRDPDVGRAVADAYSERRDHRAVELVAGGQAALSTLDGRYRLGMVTNGDPAMQSQKLDALSLTTTFETVVHAGYETAPKPDPEPFHVALDRIDASPDRAVYVGNSLHSDVPGAKAAGLDAVWFAGGEVGDSADPDPRPDYRVDSLAELTTPPWE